MKTTLFIIPGFRQSVKSNAYQRLSHILGEHYHVVLIPITWNRRVMSDYVEEALDFITSHSKTDAPFDVLGFSFGAMVAFITAPILHPRRLFLCSLSPYFKEDIPMIRNRWRLNIGYRRVADFNNFNFAKIIPAIKSNTIVFAGSKEIAKFPTLNNRIKKAHNYIKDSQLIIIKDAGHDIGNQKYQQAIYDVI